MCTMCTIRTIRYDMYAVHAVFTLIAQFGKCKGHQVRHIWKIADLKAEKARATTTHLQKLGGRARASRAYLNNKL